MQQLRKVLTQTTWANASDAINKNSDRIYEAITRVENATTKNKGYFETSNALLDTYPNPNVGDIAFVFNSANTVDTPYDVYKAAFSSTTNMYEWYDSGINASFADVDINSVNDSIKDIEQQVDTLKDPRLPIICDANGRIGLNVGNGLYVDSNGDLCATQSIGGGGGSGSGGESYYAAAGISINEDNFISVKIGASLEFDNDNALKVGTGEGLVHNSNGKLSVNVGKGLVIDDKTNAIEIEEYDAIKEIPIAIQKKQDRLTQGSGIEITSENIINVDGSNLQVLLSTNAINDEDGNRIRATYAKKEEVGGIYEAIEATNTTVASHTQSIESLELNKQDKLDFGNGLSTVGNLVKVEDAVLKDIADNKKNIDTLSSSIGGKQDKLTQGSGIKLDDGKLSVHIGTGLEFDPLSSAVVVKVGAGIKTDINQSLTIKHDTTLTTDADGQLGVNQSTITNIAASEVAKVVANAPANYDTLKEIADYIATDAEGAAQLSNRIGALESALPNKMDTIAFGSGLAFSSNVVKVADAVMTDIANNKSNISKLQSSVDGLSTSKQDTISDLATIRSNAANGATAYGWGDHSKGGYAKQARLHNKNIPTDASGTIILPDYPTSLPANGGNADTADKLSTPRYIWGQSFDGSDNVNGNAYMRKDLGANLDDWIAYQHNSPLEVGRVSNTMCLAMGVTDDDIAYIQSKGNGITSSAPLVLQPADDGRYYYGGLYYSKHKYPILHTGNLSTYFTNGFEQVNDTIKISTSYIAQNIKGDGLVLDESGKMNVDSSKVVTISDSQIITGAKIFNPGKFILAGVEHSDIKHSTQKDFNWGGFNEGATPAWSGMYNTLDFQWYGHTWSIGNIRSGAETSNGFGVGKKTINSEGKIYFQPSLRVTETETYINNNKAIHEGNISEYVASLSANYAAGAGNADALDGHDSSYFATKTELGNKQNTLAFGSGIAHSNNTIWVDGSQLNVNYANSAGSVAWGNVSGRPSFGSGFDSTNNVVQLKLSTGLAIDDRGYLYVTGL